MNPASPRVDRHDFGTLRLEVEDRVATITLDREPRNAFTREMGRELSQAFRTCDRDEEVRAVVLTGRPPAFCAGADLSGGEDALASPSGGDDHSGDHRFSAGGVDHPAWRVRKPVIAAVNGHAVGIGLTLALQCDIRILAAEAKYGVVQARRGVIGDAWSHWVLPRVAGMSRAAEILLTGATFDGARALELGVASTVLPADEVLPHARALAREVAVHTAPMSVAASKQLLWSSFENDAGAIGRAETRFHEVLMAHDDVREGVRAHRERREPRWTGRVDELPGLGTGAADQKPDQEPDQEPHEIERSPDANH